MSLNRLLLHHFRNHRDTRIEETRHFNLLIGENGAGKTNILEALSLFAPGRGLRRAAISDMARQRQHDTPLEHEQRPFDLSEGFAISADLGTPSGPVRLGTGVQPQRPNRRIVQINEADASGVELGQWLSLSWLTPAMDRLFMEGAGARRRFLDRLVLAKEPNHARNASRLETALRERNRLLSELYEPNPQWLNALELQIAHHGSQVIQARMRMIEALSHALAFLPNAPFARPCLSYLPTSPSEEEPLAEALRDGRRRDRAAKRTLIGPHRDDLIVTMMGKGSKEGMPAGECSTGEQKAMLIALILAHAEALNDDRPRLLLLDEVAAHLDPIRREALFDRLRHGQAQVWLTGTELAPFAAIEQEAAIWQIENGAATRIA